MVSITGYEVKRVSNLDLYRKHVGQFVWAMKKDGKASAGILRLITSEGHLHIQGKYKTAIIDYNEIVDFSARDDRRGGHY